MQWQKPRKQNSLPNSEFFVCVRVLWAVLPPEVYLHNWEGYAAIYGISHIDTHINLSNIKNISWNLLLCAYVCENENLIYACVKIVNNGKFITQVYAKICKH